MSRHVAGRASPLGLELSNFHGGNVAGTADVHDAGDQI